MNELGLEHWHAIKTISVDQAGYLIAGTDPFDIATASAAVAARARTYTLAIQQASERAFLYAHELVSNLDREPHDPWLVDIWEMSDSFDRYLPSLELRNSVAEVLKQPATVPLLMPSDPWFSETVYAGELRRWLTANHIKTAYMFPDDQSVVIRDRGLTCRKESHSQTTVASAQVTQAVGRWPWGEHETSLLRKLAAAAERYWVNYEPSDATTAPTNLQVINWLKSQGVAERTAEVMATILRIDGLPTGPRK